MEFTDAKRPPWAAGRANGQATGRPDFRAAGGRGGYVKVCAHCRGVKKAARPAGRRVHRLSRTAVHGLGEEVLRVVWLECRAELARADGQARDAVLRRACVRLCNLGGGRHAPPGLGELFAVLANRAKLGALTRGRAAKRGRDDAALMSQYLGGGGLLPLAFLVRPTEGGRAMKARRVLQKAEASAAEAAGCVASGRRDGCLNGLSWLTMTVLPWLDGLSVWAGYGATCVCALRFALHAWSRCRVGCMAWQAAAQGARCGRCEELAVGCPRLHDLVVKRPEPDHDAPTGRGSRAQWAAYAAQGEPGAVDILTVEAGRAEVRRLRSALARLAGAAQHAAPRHVGEGAQVLCAPQEPGGREGGREGDARPLAGE